MLNLDNAIVGFGVFCAFLASFSLGTAMNFELIFLKTMDIDAYWLVHSDVIYFIVGES